MRILAAQDVLDSGAFVGFIFASLGADWSARYPLIIDEAHRLRGSAILDAEVVCPGKNGVADFDALHSRTDDHIAVACAFDLLMLNDDDMQCRLFAEQGSIRQTLFRSRAASNTLNMPKVTEIGCLTCVRAWPGRHCVEEIRPAVSLGEIKSLESRLKIRRDQRLRGR